MDNRLRTVAIATSLGGAFGAGWLLFLAPISFSFVAVGACLAVFAGLGVAEYRLRRRGLR